VSLLRSKGYVSLRDSDSQRALACWEVMDCNEEMCPVHKSGKGPCWLVPRTRCFNSYQKDFRTKLASCLMCDYFEAHANEDPMGWNGFVADQVRVYFEDALKHAYQREEGFFQVLDRLPDGLFTTDREWKITYINPAAEQITGFWSHDAVGMYCKDVFKNSICETDCAVKQAVETGRNIYNREYRIRNALGREVPIICSTSVLRGAHGEVLGGIEVFKDITDKKRLEDERIASERKYRRIFEGSQDMIYVASRTGDLLDVNPAGVAMLGYRDKEDLLSVGNVNRLYLNADAPRTFQEIIDREGIVKDFETELVRGDGSRITVLINGNSVLGTDGRVELVEGLAKDITLRKQAEKNLQQRNRELQLLNNIALTMNLTMNLDTILQFALENVLAMLGLKSGGVYLIDRDAGGLALRAQVGMTSGVFGEKGAITLKDDRLMKALFQENISFAPKPRFPSFLASVPLRNSHHELDFHCFLITAKNKASGFFSLELPPGRELNIKEKDLMGSIGNFLGAAIENTTLMTAVKRHREELQRLAGELFHSQERERKRIAQELHDEAGQSLTGINLSLETALRAIPEDLTDVKSSIEEAQKQVNRTYQEMRRLSHRLHPAMLDDLGLKPALSEMLEYISANSGLNVDFNMVGFDGRLDPEIETVLYRFSQEALQNTLKHSGAENFKLSIVRSYPRIILVAEDDGVGFDPEQEETHKGLGLLGMRERAAMLDGTFNMRTQPGVGTRIRVEIPIREKESDG